MEAPILLYQGFPTWWHRNKGLRQKTAAVKSLCGSSQFIIRKYRGWLLCRALRCTNTARARLMKRGRLGVTEPFE